MNIEKSESPSTYSNLTYRVETTDGTMFIAIMEADNGKPVGIQINIGKAGIALSAWAHAMSRILTVALEHGASINDLIRELSSITTDRERRIKNGSLIRSGPEGICYVLMQHSAKNYDEWCRKMNVNRDTIDELSRLDD